MTTLRVLLAAPPSANRAEAWALFDAAGACVRTGVDRPAAWPTADRLEVVVAAPQLRIASVALPPMPASRVAAAAGFALDDQLAGPASAHQLAASRQAPDGHVRVVVIARALLAGIAGSRGDIARIIAEPDLALPLVGWRWCVSEGAGSGFVRRPDGSAFPVGAPSREGALPPELALALAQARRKGDLPADVRVDAAYADAPLAAWRGETGVAFVRGTPWRWHAAPAAAFLDAIGLQPGAGSTESAPLHRFPGRIFAPALWLAGAALGLHVAATAAEWAALKFDAWRDARVWTTLALSAGIAADAAASPSSARAALASRYAELRHANALAAPDDGLPLLARATPALAGLPTGAVKSATYSSGHWTLDLARADAALVSDLDVRMRSAGIPVLIATSPAGARVRFGGP